MARRSPFRFRRSTSNSAIADCLSSLDALIAAQTQKLDSPQDPQEGLMQQLFPSPEEVEA